MAVRLALAGARVTGADGTVYEKVSVVGRNGNEVVFTSGGDVLATLTNANANRVASAVWDITSDQGAFTATILRDGGCGCGR